MVWLESPLQSHCWQKSTHTRGVVRASVWLPLSLIPFVIQPCGAAFGTEAATLEEIANCPASGPATGSTCLQQTPSSSIDHEPSAEHTHGTSGAALLQTSHGVRPATADTAASLSESEAQGAGKSPAPSPLLAAPQIAQPAHPLHYWHDLLHHIVQWAMAAKKSASARVGAPDQALVELLRKRNFAYMEKPGFVVITVAAASVLIVAIVLGLAACWVWPQPQPLLAYQLRMGGSPWESSRSKASGDFARRHRHDARSSANNHEAAEHLAVRYEQIPTNLQQRPRDPVTGEVAYDVLSPRFIDQSHQTLELRGEFHPWEQADGEIEVMRHDPLSTKIASLKIAEQDGGGGVAGVVVGGAGRYGGYASASSGSSSRKGIWISPVHGAKTMPPVAFIDTRHAVSAKGEQPPRPRYVILGSIIDGWHCPSMEVARHPKDATCFLVRKAMTNGDGDLLMTVKDVGQGKNLTFQDARFCLLATMTMPHGARIIQVHPGLDASLVFSTAIAIAKLSDIH